MCRSTVNIQSPTAEIRRAKKKEEERNRMKIYMVSLFHRATIKYPALVFFKYLFCDTVSFGLLVHSCFRCVRFSFLSIVLRKNVSEMAYFCVQ